MKTREVSRKLSLNKATVANLDESQMKDVKGGEHDHITILPPYCTNWCTNFCITGIYACP